MIVNYADHSANERTFLSWVRTAVAFVGFGLAAARIADSQTPLWSEMALLGSGAFVIAVAYIRMLSLRRRIASAVEYDDAALLTDALLVVLMIALFVMLAMFSIHVT